MRLCGGGGGGGCGCMCVCVCVRRVGGKVNILENKQGEIELT